MWFSICSPEVRLCVLTHACTLSFTCEFQEVKNLRSTYKHYVPEFFLGWNIYVCLNFNNWLDPLNHRFVKFQNAVWDNFRDICFSHTKGKTQRSAWVTCSFLPQPHFQLHPPPPPCTAASLASFRSLNIPSSSPCKVLHMLFLCTKHSSNARSSSCP